MDCGVNEVRLHPPSGARQVLRILLSAYACEPRKGSEPGIGWHWAVALAHAGHEVWVLTRANNRNAIEEALAAQPMRNLRFVYYDLPAWARWWKRGGRGVRLYYVLWQWGAYRIARELCREVRFDVVHHITFGVFRHPSFMAFLDVPFIFGPVGGGETTPRQLRRTFRARGYWSDVVRDAANWIARIDPLMSAVYRRSAAILCKTRETLRCIPQRYQDKCRVQVEVGTSDEVGLAPVGRPHRETTGLRVLYVGRLIYWKGLHLALKAFAKFRAAYPGSHFTVVGSGPDAGWFRDLAQRLGIGDAVTWIPWLEQDAVMRTYPHHDAFLFPSLHDSSGNAVLEALASGLPVVCLDVGGPAVLVDASCGFLVRAGAPQRVVEELAQSLAALAGNAGLKRSMAEAATRRAHQHFSWAHQAARMESIYMALRTQPDAGQQRLGQHIERGVS
jgi:glycosyltransferase involved in cell wall biosynthesis